MSKAEQLRGFKALDQNQFFRFLVKEVKRETDRAKATVFYHPQSGSGLGEFLLQQQAIGEARMGEKLESFLQSLITTLTEEIKDSETEK